MLKIALNFADYTKFMPQKWYGGLADVGTNVGVGLNGWYNPSSLIDNAVSSIGGNTAGLAVERLGKNIFNPGSIPKVLSGAGLKSLAGGGVVGAIPGLATSAALNLGEDALYKGNDPTVKGLENVGNTFLTTLATTKSPLAALGVTGGSQVLNPAFRRGTDPWYKLLNGPATQAVSTVGDLASTAWDTGKQNLKNEQLTKGLHEKFQAALNNPPTSPVVGSPNPIVKAPEPIPPAINAQVGSAADKLNNPDFDKITDPVKTGSEYDDIQSKIQRMIQQIEARRNEQTPTGPILNADVIKHTQKPGFNINNITKQNFKKFRYMDDDELIESAMHQGPIKKIMEWADKHQPGSSNEFLEKIKNDRKGQIAGTIYSTPHGKGIGISREISKDIKSGKLPKDELRKTLAHEAFHANVPILGNSELLAHTYGGLRSKSPIKGVAQELSHAITNRPFRIGGELAITGGLGYGAYKGIQAIKDKFTQKTASYEDIKGRLREFLAKYMGIKPKIDKNRKIKLQPTVSSNIKAYGYSPTKKLLEIQFKSKGDPRYRYSSISMDKYKGLQEAESKGKYFSKEIKPTLLYEKMK